MRTDVGRLAAFVAAWWKIVRCALRRNLDIVHIHTSIRGSLLRKSLLALTCVCLRQNYILHIHNGAMESYLDGLPRILRHVIGTIWRRARKVICLSRDMQAWIVGRWRFSEEKCPVIYNGIPDPLLAGLQHAVQSEPLSILFLGRLVEGKGIRTLLDAVKNLHLSGYSCKLLVAGSGDVPVFIEDVESRGLSEHVEYLGWVTGEEKSQLLIHSDIFVLPSRSEGFSVAIVEAMAFGAAIVSTDIPGVVDAVTHEREALLVPPDDAAALCDALRTMLESPALRANLSAAARQRFLDRFTVQHMAERLVREYRHALM